MSSFGVIEKIKTIDNFMVNKEHLSNNMKKIFTTTLIISLILFNSCEDVNVALPGNTQDLDPKPPQGAIDWVIAMDEVTGNGQLEENSAAGKTIGTLSATDPNPDDEFTYTITGQTMDGTSVNYFVLKSDSGINNLELSNGNINYEELTGSKQVRVTIQVSDDSPSGQNSDFPIYVDIINVNETPLFQNLNQIVRYADEYIEYESPRIEWTDIDEGDNPSLTTTNLPGWLSIDSEGNIGSSSGPASSDVGNHEFLLNISDGEITVQEEINIEVRENLAPEFTNTGSIPNSIRVGCYDDNDRIVDLNWNDPNNSTSYFNGNDIVAFTHQGLGSVEWLNFDNDDEGKLFCVRAPENSDAGTIPITISLADNRPSNPLSTEFSFDLELIENDAPEFTNLGNFPNTISVGDTIYFDVEWQDPNSDAIDFSVTENYSWFIWDNSGNITMAPRSSHVNTYEIPFNISDGCYTSTTIKTLTVEE